MGKSDDGATRITQQFHDRDGMTYDLRSCGLRLTVRVRARRNPAEQGEWRVEARTKESDATMVLVAWGRTRADAFETLRRAWTSDAGLPPLASVEWPAIAESLHAVRAL